MLISACASSLKKVEKRGFNSGHSGYSRGHGLGSYATGFNSALNLHTNYAPNYSFGKSTGNFASSNLGLSSYGLGKNERITGITVNREIRIPIAVPQLYPVPQPYPVKVDRPYPIVVPHPVPVEVTRTVPIKIEQPYPVPIVVRQPIPVAVIRTVPNALSLAAANSYSGSDSYSELDSGFRAGSHLNFATAFNSGSSSRITSDPESGSSFHSGYVSETVSGTSSDSFSKPLGTFSGFESGSYSSLDSESSFNSASGSAFGSNLPLLHRNSPSSGYSYPIPSKKFTF